MLAFFHQRAKRRIVWATLVAWVLALLAGVANACLLQDHDFRIPAPAASAHEGVLGRDMNAAIPFHVEHGNQDGAPLNVDDSRDAAKAVCVKFCDDESSTIAKVQTLQLDLPGPLLLARIDWQTELPVATVAMRRVAERPASQGPPLVIRFLRLTI
jgi:hypothetical protein